MLPTTQHSIIPVTQYYNGWCSCLQLCYLYSLMETFSKKWQILAIGQGARIIRVIFVINFLMLPMFTLQMMLGILQWRDPTAVKVIVKLMIVPVQQQAQIPVPSSCCSARRWWWFIIVWWFCYSNSSNRKNDVWSTEQGAM